MICSYLDPRILVGSERRGQTRHYLLALENWKTEQVCSRAGVPLRYAAPPTLRRQGYFSGPEPGAMFHFGTPARQADRPTMFPFSLRIADCCGAKSPQLDHDPPRSLRRHTPTSGRRAAMAPARPLDRAEAARPVPQRERWRSWRRSGWAATAVVAARVSIVAGSEAGVSATRWGRAWRVNRRERRDWRDDRNRCRG